MYHINKRTRAVKGLARTTILKWNTLYCGLIIYNAVHTPVWFSKLWHQSGRTGTLACLDNCVSNKNTSFYSFVRHIIFTFYYTKYTMTLLYNAFWTPLTIDLCIISRLCITDASIGILQSKGTGHLFLGNKPTYFQWTLLTFREQGNMSICFWRTRKHDNNL